MINKFEVKINGMPMNVVNNDINNVMQMKEEIPVIEKVIPKIKTKTIIKEQAE